MPAKRPAIPAATRREILIESGHRCAACGGDAALEFAHIRDWAKSKDHSAANLLCLCAKCHARADKEKWGTRTLEEYKARPWIVRSRAEPPRPSYASQEIQALSEKLEESHLRLEELTSQGDDTTEVRTEILGLKRRIRDGGQLKAGDLLLGRFSLLEMIGRGGFANVWKAFDRQRLELAAVKVLHGQYAADRTRRQRFFRGAKQMARLRHRGIVAVVEGKCEDEGYRFFAMEHAAGGDLRRAVLDGKLGPDDAFKKVLEVGEALQHAHEHGVVHRDVKPANILLDGRGQPMLTDFDLARALDTTGGTRTGSALGTFLYMAPEAMSDAKEVGVAADVYSLAMTAAFALHGRELPHDVLRDSERFLGALRCPEGVRDALRAAASWEVEERPASVAAFLRALREGDRPRNREEAPRAREGPGAQDSAPVEATPRRGRKAHGRKPAGAKAFLEHLEAGNAAEALGALHNLIATGKVSARELEEELRASFHDLAISGAPGLTDGVRPFAVESLSRAAAAIEVSDTKALGVVAWALDRYTISSRTQLPDAGAVRDELLAPRRRAHPPLELSALELAEIPPGSFQMGSPEGEGSDDERPRHEVTLSGFRMLAHPVTNRLYRLLVPDHEGEDDLPAVGLSWYSAYVYAAWLGGRLPTEAEWEYASRAGCGHAYCDRHGKPTTLEKVGWYDGNSGNKLHPVKQLEPNPWGLYDMIGNAWEWMADWFGSYPAEIQEDPWGPASGGGRVMRGGSAWGSADVARAAYRVTRYPDFRFQYLGFRVVLPAAPSR